jgi:hypothetical protein
MTDEQAERLIAALERIAAALENRAGTAGTQPTCDSAFPGSAR